MKALGSPQSAGPWPDRVDPGHEHPNLRASRSVSIPVHAGCVDLGGVSREGAAAG